jgi:hypothetical protein
MLCGYGSKQPFGLNAEGQQIPQHHDGQRGWVERYVPAHASGRDIPKYPGYHVTLRTAGGGVLMCLVPAANVTEPDPTAANSCAREGCPHPGTKKCRRCQREYYCGSECQRACWGWHKKVCRF